MTRKHQQKKKTTAKIFSAAELLEKAEEALERGDLDTSVALYESALQTEPQNVEVYDAFGEVLLEMGEEERAMQLLQQSVLLRPDENFVKYMSLAQLLGGHDALRSYQKGVELILREQRAVNSGEHEGDMKWLSNQLCLAFVGMASLYLSDLCFDDNAEQECERYINSALSANPESIEALQKLASFKISQQDPEAAVKALESSMAKWYREAPEDHEDEKDEQDTDDEDNYEDIPSSMDAEEAELPDYELRIETVELLLELNLPDRAAGVCSGLLQENDEDPALLYLAATAANFQDDLDTAKEYLHKAMELSSRLDAPPEQKEQMATLWREVTEKFQARLASMPSES